jgi:hypothetical protein
MNGKRRQQESPEVLRDIARRSRTIADAVAEPDKGRIIAYAKELEQLATSLEASRDAITG